jgi:hypothetical protein
MDIYEHLWTFMDFYGHLWTFMDIYGHLWTFMDIKDFHGTFWSFCFGFNPLWYGVVRLLANTFGNNALLAPLEARIWSLPFLSWLCLACCFCHFTEKIATKTNAMHLLLLLLSRKAFLTTKVFFSICRDN